MILTADIGTTAIKAALIDRTGIKKSARVTSPEFSKDYTIDTYQWTAVLKKAFSELGESVKKADCIIISGNGPTLAPSCGGTAFLWMNRQAQKESSFISEKTGQAIDPSFFLPKILYIKNNFPKLYAKADFFLSTPEFISFVLTDCARTIMPLEGLEKWYWNNEMLDLFEIERTKLPPFIKPGEFLGCVTQKAALEFGLTRGTPVLAGCPDFVGAIIGSGAMHNGQICDRTGTSEGINFCSSKKNDNPNLMCYRHPNTKDWNVSGIISTTGKAIEYIHNLLGNGEDIQSFINKALTESKPGSGNIIFHPYLTGERAPIWDCNIRASFSGISIDSTKWDYVRSVLEGTCFAVKHVLGLFEKGTEIRIVGTPALDDRLNQLKADITQMPVTTIQETEPGLLGLGILAYSSLENADITQTCDKLIKTKKTFIPNPDTANIYSGLFDKYASKN